MDRVMALKNVEAYAVEVNKSMHPHAIVLYGSYAKGTAGPDSDIDVAVIFDGYEGDWLKDSAFLWKLTRKISTYIEPVLLDITKDQNGFVQEVLNTGYLIETQKTAGLPQN